MTEPSSSPMTGRTRTRWWKYLLVALLAIVLVVGGVAWYASTQSFQIMVRHRLVAELEKITGGRVELKSFHAVPFRLRVEVRDLTIHGKEAPGEAPYAKFDSLTAQVKIISVLGAEFAFDSLIVVHPVIHIIVYPDGSTNQPPAAEVRASGKNPVEQLFSLSIGRMEVRRGELLWNDQKLPLDFVAQDVSAGMLYSFLQRRYESTVKVGKVDTKLTDYRPFAWSAEAKFSLAQDQLDIQSLTLSCEKSRVSAHGRVSNFRQPKVDGDYAATLDLGEIAAITRQRDLRYGLLDVRGKGSWSLDQFTSQGKLSLRDFDWKQRGLMVSRANINSDYWLSNQQLRMTKIEGRAFGGVLVGDLEVTNWASQAGPAASAKNGKAADEQRGVLRLRFQDLSLSALASTLATPARPLNRVNLVGAAKGSTDVRWRGSPRNAEAQIGIDVVPPDRVSGSQLPLTARARAVYRSRPEELVVSEFSASTPASQLHVSGNLSSNSALHIVASTRDLNEWTPIIQAFRGPEELAIALHSEGDFNGSAAGRISSLSFAGHLRVTDFDSLIPATAHTPEKTVHWDSLSANLLFAPNRFSAHEGKLRHAGAEIAFDLTAELMDRQFSDHSPFTAHLVVHEGNLAEIENLLGYSYPVDGQLNLVLQASGTRSNPHADGHLQLMHTTIQRQPIDRLVSDLRFADGEAEFNNIELDDYRGQVKGSGAYNPDDRSFRFHLTGNSFDLSRISQLQGRRFEIGGSMDFRAQGSGTLDAPIINTDVMLHDITLDRERAGDFEISAVTQGPDLRLSGRSQFKESELTIDGRVRLHDNFDSDLTLKFARLDVDSLIRLYFGGRLTGHSGIAGTFNATGPLREPRSMNVRGDLNQFFIDVENLKLENSGPIRFAVKDRVFTLEQLHLLGDLTDFTAHGSAQFSGDRELDFRADGRLNLKLIETFNPDFTSSGTVSVGLNVSGNVADPRLVGRLNVVDGSLSYADIPTGLSGINGSLSFNQNRLQIETLTAHIGGGLINLGGAVTYYDEKPNFDLTAQAQDVRLRYPPGVSSTANADLRLVGAPHAAVLSGDITVTKLALTPGFDFASYLERSKQSASVPNPNSLLNNIKLDVHVVTTPDLQMQTALAKLSGDADLRLRGTAERPIVLGRVDILEGEVSFNGAKYRLDRGDVTFTNPVRIDPVLDLQATTRVSDYDITLGINGTAEKLNLTYRSEPPLPSADIIALLAMGRTREESAALQSSTSDSQMASNLILSQALNSVVTNRAQRLFGVSRIKIDPQGIGGETSTISRGPLVTIEQQVYNNLTVTYSTNVSQSSQQIIQAEYNVTRNISIVALRDYNGVVSFDIRVRQRKK